MVDGAYSCPFAFFLFVESKGDGGAMPWTMGKMNIIELTCIEC